MTRPRPLAKPTRIDLRHILAHTHRAITGRLGHPAPQALRDYQDHRSFRLPAHERSYSVTLYLDSAGNAAAVCAYMNQRGYLAADTGPNPDGSGRAVTVRLRT